MPREKRLIQITGRTQYQNFTEWQQHNSGGLPSEENLDFLVDYDIVDRRNNFASINNRGIEVIPTAGIFTVAFLSLEREGRFRLRKGQYPTLIGLRAIPIRQQERCLRISARECSASQDGQDHRRL